jgi:hypothetical protein
MLIHPSFLLFILNTIVITFEQFFGMNSSNSKTLHATGRNERRNPFKTDGPMIANDRKLNGKDRKNSDVEAVAKGFTSRVFLSPIKASQLANQYGIDLPEEGQEKSINSNPNSSLILIKQGGKFYLRK